MMVAQALAGLHRQALHCGCTSVRTCFNHATVITRKYEDCVVVHALLFEALDHAADAFIHTLDHRQIVAAICIPVIHVAVDRLQTRHILFQNHHSEAIAARCLDSKCTSSSLAHHTWGRATSMGHLRLTSTVYTAASTEGALASNVVRGYMSVRCNGA